MATATLTKVGNSMAVLLPKALRQEAAIDQDTPLRLASPRKGVVVIPPCSTTKRIDLLAYDASKHASLPDAIR